MFNVSCVIWLRLPELPEIFRVKVPLVAAEDAANVSEAEALPPEGGVTTEGESDAVTPFGSVDRLKFVGLLKPFRLETITVAAALPP